ncbi:MAG: hypothetical protein JEZ00_20175 [Anaerolineaceae bacterium]|nr:hypothetical protein [Anaerolineaceae bacterium]
MKTISLFVSFFLLIFGLAACVMPANTNIQYQVQEYTEEVWHTDTPTLTSTVQATATAQPSQTVTVSPTSTITVQYATATPFILSEMNASRTDRIMVLEDINYPDATVLKPAQLIMKTWRVQNTGTDTWNRNYRMTYVQEDNTYNGPVFSRVMFFPPDTTLGWNIGSWPEPLEEVQPGEIVDLTILLQLPNKHGYKFGSWHILNDKGEFLGTPLWSQLQVNGSIAEDQLGWNGSWLMNDPFFNNPFQPVTLVLETNDQWVHGYFYNNLGDIILISGLTGNDRLIMDGMYGSPNQRVGGTAILLQIDENGHTLSGTVWHENSVLGSLCADRDEKRYARACLPEVEETKEPTEEGTKEPTLEETIEAENE